MLCTATGSAWAKLDSLKLLTLERNARLCGYWARVGEMTGYNATQVKINFMESAQGYGAAMAQGWGPGARMSRADYASMEQALAQCEQRRLNRPVARNSASKSLTN
jgi:hypothetical protein